MYRHHLEKLVRTRLDDVLVDEGVLDRSKLQEIQSEQDQSGSLLSDVLIDSGGFDEFELAKIQVKSYGLPFVDVKLFNIRREVLEVLPFDYCKRRGVLPIEQFGQSLAIACWEIPTPELLEELITKTKLSIFLYVGVRRSIHEVIDEQTKKLTRNTPPRPAPAKAAPAPAAQPAPTAAPAAPQASAPARPAATVAAVPASPSASTSGSQSLPPSSVSATSSVDLPEAPLPPLSIPFISMKLHATAQDASAPRRMPAPKSTGGVVAGAALGSLLGPAGSQAPEPSLPATPAAVPAAARAASGVVKPAPAMADPQRPRITRAAPVIPAALGAAPAKSATEWESVFDQGESAVRESATGELPPKAKSRP